MSYLYRVNDKVVSIKLRVKEGIAIPSFLVIYQGENDLYRRKIFLNPAFISVSPVFPRPSPGGIVVFTLLLTGIRVCVAIF
ncbi:hypothetical protein DXB58_19550 [Bacteroides sp. OM05-10AA]|nr:hypothetical protein DXB58_19550 [Bacteroides sp. OM05-10AA]RGQ65548.1 hypothetical protein DWY87_13625 [Bacteroides sp. AF27-33]